MTTRTQIDAPVTAEGPSDASVQHEAKDDFDKSVERFERKIAVGLERFTNQFIRRVVVAGVVAVLSIKALDLLFERLLSR